MPKVGTQIFIKSMDELGITDLTEVNHSKSRVSKCLYLGVLALLRNGSKKYNIL